MTNAQKHTPAYGRLPRTPYLALAALVISTLAGASRAEAQMPIPNANTPGMIGGQTIGSGRTVLGASTGFPETRFHAIFGLGNNFDLGIQPGLTYSDNHGLSGLRQDVGLDFQVPLRWTIAHMRIASVALRVSPFFRIGQSAPAVSFGSLVGARFSIALPKIFSLIVGPEARFAFASLGNNPPGPGDNRINGFDGAVYAVMGIESFFRDKWFFNLQFDAGGYFGSDALWNHGMFNAYVGFGALM